MEVVNERGHMVLEYISLLQRHGYKPTVQEVEAYASRPHRREPVKGNPFQSVISQGFSSMWENTEIRPGESYGDYLTRLSWVRVKAGRMELSVLGHALLRGLNSPTIDSEAQSFVEVVVDPTDRFAFAKVLHQFSNLGTAMLVDPYLRLEQFIEVAEFVPVNRILTSSRALGRDQDYRQYQRAVGTTAGAIEVRYIDTLHDRYYIPESGDLWTLGVSLNGIKTNMSVLTKLGQESSSILRKAYEEQWANAAVLPPLAMAPALAEEDVADIAPASGTTSR